MNTLLIQSCSSRKASVTEPLPAIELYDGYFFRIIKKARRETDSLPVDIRILSAEHGLLHPETPIEPYDREMDAERAAELCEPVVAELANLANDYDQVIIVGGSQYRAATGGLTEATDAAVYYIRGDGIGEMGQKLKRLLWNDPAAVVDDILGSESDLKQIDGPQVSNLSGD